MDEVNEISTLRRKLAEARDLLRVAGNMRLMSGRHDTGPDPDGHWHDRMPVALLRALRSTK